MNMSKKILICIFISVVFFSVKLQINAADCNKLGCATCIYSTSNLSLKCDVRADGNGSANVNCSPEYNANNRIIYKVNHKLVGRNFISGQKLLCPSTLYIKFNAGASTTVGVDVSDVKKDGYNSFPLDSKSTNNNLNVVSSETQVAQSCSYNSSNGGTSVKVTISVVNNQLKYELSNGYNINNKDLTVSDFNGGCPNLYVSCGNHAENKYCTISKNNTGSIVHDPNKGTVEQHSDDKTNVNACPENHIRDKNGNCINQGYVAENACQENDIKKVLQLFGYILLVAKIAVPLLIIGFGTFDLFKSVVDKDEKSLGKQIKQLGIRLVAGFVVFFVPNIVYAIFSLSDALDIIDTQEYKTCAECVLEPSKCNVN